MKFIFTFLVFLALSYTGFAQHKAKYNVRVVDRSGNATRGIFYAVSDEGLTVIRNRKDTVKINAENISAISIHRRGIVAPLAIAGGLTFFILAAKSDKLVESVVLIAAGVPVGVSGGLLIGNLLSNKKRYKNLQPKDFPLIKPNLRQYAVLK